MRLIRVPTGRRLAPWDDPVGSARVCGEPLAERQARVAAAAGLRLEEGAAGEDPDTLYWEDDVDLSVGALRWFARNAGRDERLALVDRPARPRAGLDVEPAGPDWQGEPTRLYGVWRGAGALPRVVPPLGFGGTAKLPMGGEAPFFLSLRGAVTVHHWSRLLLANLGAIGPALLDSLLLRPWAIPWAWLRAPLRAGTGRLCAVGRGCDIHPTARLEGCVVGDRVRVGAYSVLRGCVLGDDALVEDHVTARLSVVDRGAHLANYAMFNLSVLGPRSSVGHIGAQATIVGEGSFVSTFATLQDLSLDGNVRVRHEGALVDSGTPFLGVAVGHRARLGAHLSVAPGREIPNDVGLVALPSGRVRSIPADLAPGTWLVHDGELRPR